MITYDVPTAIKATKRKDLKVYVENGFIKTNDNSEVLKIYNSQGVALSNKLPLKKGIYLVSIDKNSYKVHVD